MSVVRWRRQAWCISMAYAYSSLRADIGKWSRCGGKKKKQLVLRFSPQQQEPGYLHTGLYGRRFSSFAALIYTMDELDPYRDVPVSSKEDLALDAPEYSAETSTSAMNGGFRGQHADMPPVRTVNGLGYGGQGGHTRVGRREGAPLSAQASYLVMLPSDSNGGQFVYLKADAFLRESACTVFLVLDMDCRSPFRFVRLRHCL